MYIKIILINVLQFVVEQCLKTFRVILPREIALNFMIVWYRSRNAPGTQDISSEQEWKLFLEVFLRMCHVIFFIYISTFYLAV